MPTPLTIRYDYIAARGLTSFVALSNQLVLKARITDFTLHSRYEFFCHRIAKIDVNPEALIKFFIAGIILHNITEEYPVSFRPLFY